MTITEELEILRKLVEDHCQYCADCEWYKIPEEGLCTETSYRTEGTAYIVHRRNDDCQFAQYWNRRADDALWEKNPCRRCGTQSCGYHVGEDTSQPPCDHYKRWFRELKEWEKKRIKGEI